MSVSEAYLALRRPVHAGDAELVEGLDRLVRWTRRTEQWLLSTFAHGLAPAVEELLDGPGPAPVVGALGRTVTSDYATLRLFGDVPVRLLVNPGAAMLELSLRDEHVQQAARLEELTHLARRWARAHTSTDVSVAALHETLTREHLYAEEGFDQLRILIGLPDAEVSQVGRFGEMVGRPYDAAYVLPDGTKIRYGDLRFVLGKGRDFHGLWDKLDPGAPVARFPADGKGWRASRKEWAARHNALPHGEWFVD